MRTVEMYFEEYERAGFRKRETERGIIYEADPEVGCGGFRIIGEMATCYASIGAMTLKKDLVTIESANERYLTFGYYPEGESYFYQKREEAEPHIHGLNVYLHDPQLTGYMRIKAGQHLICDGLILRESFLKALPFALPDNFWEDATRILNPGPVEHPALLAICRELRHCRLTGLPLKYYVAGKGYEALSYLVDYIERRSGEYSRLSLYDREVIDRAREILELSIRRPPSIRELSVRVGVNQQKLMRLFKQMTGTTVFGYVKLVRMERASKLLKETDLPVAEVAREVGYHGDGHFQQAFASVYGVGPAQFRQEA